MRARASRKAFAYRTITFGPIAAPVKLYTAVSRDDVSGGPRDRALAAARATLIPEERKSLEALDSAEIDIAEFVPVASVDPVYLDRAYYLSPARGGGRAYLLLSQAMAMAERAAVALLVLRGRETLALIRPVGDGLMLHTMYFADEVRGFGEVDKGQDARIREGELALTCRLIDELSHDEWKPEQYHDEYRERALDMAEAKAESEADAAGRRRPARRRAKVIDLHAALKEALAKRAGRA